MAGLLSMPYEQFYQRLSVTYRDREVGWITSLEESIASVCRELSTGGVTPDQVEVVAQLHYAYVTTLLRPDPADVETLGALRSRGLKIGLISNCGPDVPRLWPDSPLASQFDVTVFSCQVGMRKPDPRIQA